MEVLIQKKNVIFDSQIASTLMSCARLTNFRFNMDLVSVKGKSPSLEKGSLVHTILEWYYKSILAGKSRSDAITIGYDAGKEYVQGYLETNKYVTNKEHDGAHLPSEDIETVSRTMEEYFDYYKSEHWTPIDVEYVKQAVIYEDDECRIIWKAKTDLAVDTNNGIYPVDHKTHSSRRDTISLSNQFYGLCTVWKTRGVIIDKIGFQKTLKASEKFTRPIISYSVDRLIEWSQVIIPFWAKQYIAYHEIGYWPPNFTHCQNKYDTCAFLDVCEVDTGMREETLRIQFHKGKKWDVTND